MKTLFVTAEDDLYGVTALKILQSLGAESRVLGAGINAPWNGIALFKSKRVRPTGSGYYLKTAALRLDGNLIPDWARTTPFRVEVYNVDDRHPSGKRSQAASTFRRALENLLDMYTRWNPGNTADPVPWAKLDDPAITGKLYAQLALDWYHEVTVTETWPTLIASAAVTISSAQRLADRKIAAGGWAVNVSERSVAFPTWAQLAGSQFLATWQQHFADENTWVREQIGVPSLFVRLDCVLIDGTLRVHEVEERPAGPGITTRINPQFAELFGGMRKGWPDFVVVVSPKRTGSDDHLWAETMEHNDDPGQLVLVRAEPEEAPYLGYVGRSVSSVTSKGDKSYGVPMGWWKLVQHTAALPWDTPFVLKPTQGSKCRDVEVWLPPGSSEAGKYKGGVSTKFKIAQTMAAKRQMYLQPFHAPMPVEGFPDMHMILRVFYGYNTNSHNWICLGGTWNARNNVVIHGASDAVFGPVVLD